MNQYLIFLFIIGGMVVVLTGGYVAPVKSVFGKIDTITVISFELFIVACAGALMIKIDNIFITIGFDFVMFFLAGWSFSKLFHRK